MARTGAACQPMGMRKHSARHVPRLVAASRVAAAPALASAAGEAGRSPTMTLATGVFTNSAYRHAISRCPAVDESITHARLIAPRR